jgi:hypothetical protein
VIAAAARRHAERTRLAQGLPAYVDDPATVARLAALVDDGVPANARDVPVHGAQAGVG